MCCPQCGTNYRLPTLCVVLLYTIFIIPMLILQNFFINLHYQNENVSYIWPFVGTLVVLGVIYFFVAVFFLVFILDPKEGETLESGNEDAEKVTGKNLG